LDENFDLAYLERAKNFHYSRDSNSAFADLQKYISLKPNDPEIHKWAGNLLFNSCAFDDAVKAYSHSDVIE
jgi:tetratricopeptide (TPR) repeat protein